MLSPYSKFSAGPGWGIHFWVRPATNSVYPQPNQTLWYLRNRFLCSFPSEKQDNHPQAWSDPFLT